MSSLKTFFLCLPAALYSLPMRIKLHIMSYQSLIIRFLNSFFPESMILKRKKIKNNHFCSWIQFLSLDFIITSEGFLIFWYIIMNSAKVCMYYYVGLVNCNRPYIMSLCRKTASFFIRHTSVYIVNRESLLVCFIPDKW